MRADGLIYPDQRRDEDSGHRLAYQIEQAPRCERCGVTWLRLVHDHVSTGVKVAFQHCRGERRKAGDRWVPGEPVWD